MAAESGSGGGTALASPPNVERRATTKAPADAVREKRRSARLEVTQDGTLFAASSDRVICGFLPTGACSASDAFECEAPGLGAMTAKRLEGNLLDQGVGGRVWIGGTRPARPNRYEGMASARRKALSAGARDSYRSATANAARIVGSDQAQSLSIETPAAASRHPVQKPKSR